MEIVKSRLCGVPMLRVVGDVDHFTSPTLLGAAKETIDPKTAKLLLDLEACPYLDSGGMNALLTILRQAKSGQGWLGVIAPNHDVHRLLRMVALTADPGFRVFESLLGAEEQLQNEAPGGQDA